MFKTSLKIFCKKRSSLIFILICVSVLLWSFVGIFNSLVASTAYKIDEDFVVANQDDPVLVELVRKLVLPPSTLPYKLEVSHRRHYSQLGQSIYADYLLKKQNGGFFIEVGAENGEHLSNSLFFEKSRGWSGLLIEPDPDFFAALSSKRRKAYTLNAGVSLNTTSYYAKFKPNLGLGRITSEGENLITIKTFPLYTMLLALKVSTVDFLSLDIEGDELKVLRSIPWDKITVRLLCVEVNHLEEGPLTVISYMKEQGYTFLGVKDIDAWFAHPTLKMHL